MNRHVWLAALLSSFLTLALVLGSLAIFTGALAASDTEAEPAPQAQEARAYLSFSSMAFLPYSEVTLAYRRNFEGQMLSLNSSTRQVEGRNNWFVTPLRLPDNSRLTGVTVHGQDFDSAGWVEIALWRCAHLGGASCVNLGLWQSGEAYASGRFNSGRISLNEVVDNQAFSYTLAARIFAVNDSGLRSVLLEVTEAGGITPPISGGIVGRTEQWSLPNRGVTTQLAANLDPASTVQICNYASSAAEVEVQYNGQSQTLRPGNCTRLSGSSSYSVKNIGLYGRSAAGSIEFLA